jgi:hypothetical protein
MNVTCLRLEPSPPGRLPPLPAALREPKFEKSAATSEQWRARHAREVLRVTDYRDQTLILFKIDN